MNQKVFRNKFGNLVRILYITTQIQLKSNGKQKEAQTNMYAMEIVIDSENKVPVEEVGLFRRSQNNG